MVKMLVGFLSFAKFVIRGDKGIASFGPMNVLAGMGVLGLSFCVVVGFSGLQSDRNPGIRRITSMAWYYDSKETTPIQGCVVSQWDLYYYGLMNKSQDYSQYGLGGTH